MNDNLNTSDPYYKSKAYGEDRYEEEIDIKELIGKVWLQRKFILIFTGIFTLIGIFVAFTSPVSYTSQSILVPQSGAKGNGGSLGGIASMMGVNLGSSASGESLSPSVYPQIIKSVPFRKDIMNTPIVVEKSSGHTISLYDYYTNKEYQPVNIIGGIKKYTIGLPGLIFSSLRKSDSSSDVIQHDSTTNNTISISEKERSVLSVINDNISFSYNEKDGYITLGYSFSEPEATAAIAENLYLTLERYVTRYKSQKQQDNLEFVQESYDRAHKDFMEKQSRLATFQDANRNLATATAQATQRRLSAEYDVAYTVYNELAKQLEQAKISVKQSRPVLTVIDPVVVPHEKSAPRRGFIIFVFILLGFVVSVGWVFVKPFFKDLKTSLNENKK